MNKLLLSMVLMASVMAPGLQGAASNAGNKPHRGDAWQQENRLIRFFQAACLGEEGAIRYINYCLSNDLIDVNQQDRNGRTALHHAVKNNNYDVATCLMSYNADPYKVDINDESPMSIAGMNMDESMLNILTGASSLSVASSDQERGQVAEQAPVNSVPAEVVGGAQEVRVAANAAGRVPVIANPVQPARATGRQEPFSEGARTGQALKAWVDQYAPRMSVQEKDLQRARWAAEAPLAQARFEALWGRPVQPPAIAITQQPAEQFRPR